jgi:YD repeat-containing protein
MPEKLIKKVRTSEGDLQIDYNALANLPDLSVINDLNASLDEVKSDLGDVAQTYETKKDAAQKLADAKTYTDEQIAAIPTPDVSGQIDAHNANAESHNDIRLDISNLATRFDAFEESSAVYPSNIDMTNLDNGIIVEKYTDGTTKTTTMEFDADGNPVKITDGNGNETVLTW